MSLCYSRIEPDDNLTNLVREYGKETFGVDLPQDKVVGKGCSVKSNDDRIKLEFGWESSTIHINGASYRCYKDSALPYVKVALDFIRQIGVGSVSKLEFYKYNELGYKSDAQVGMPQLLAQMFSAELVAKISDEDKNTMSELARWEKAVQWDDNESSRTMTVEFGFQRNGTDGKNGCITLRSKVESIEDTSINNILPRLESFNGVLDNAFHWCMASEVIQNMSKTL